MTLGADGRHNQQNAFGSGNSLGMQINTSRINRIIVVNTTDPYFTKDACRERSTCTTGI